MFRTLLAPIIRSITTVYAAPGTRARGCIYGCYTPDDGCKKCPKHVEWSRSEIKVTAQLHRVGLFNTTSLRMLNLFSSTTNKMQRYTIYLFL